MRIYLDEEIDVTELNDTLVIEGDNHHYLKNVLRSKVDDKLGVLTSNKFYNTLVTDVDKRYTTASIISSRDLIPYNYEFVVYQCILKREYMDYVVEKYTELGVTSIVPVYSERSVGVIKDNTHRRYLDIIKKASLQSERDYLPTIEEPIKIEEIKTLENGNNIFFYERGEDKSLPIIKESKGKPISVQILIGPEGGFTQGEVDILLMKQFEISSPISAILKAETAAIVFAGYIKMLLEQATH